ncbi:unnamed protein product [Parnassius mnemosyne]|uniref:Uncharacterized protein n=1 Tax=Parnassius mnemosyne TaxID=213953 RepID=A0AAV1M915_9NEOP
MKRSAYKSSTKQVIFKVFRVYGRKFGHTLLEKAGKFLSDLDDVYGRTAKITGVSESTNRRIVDDDEYFACGGSLYNDIDKLVISVNDDSSSESEESEMDQFNYAGASGNISGVEYLDSD